ncbi:MAG TPA: AIR synthase related protein, partial [Planctomycetaceae bacterium]|nr:AIR synthase related protein [Planctomycetaceae bacterium]
RVNLSDLAAKGARPEFYLLNLALPRPPRAEWLADFAQGLADDQRQFGLSLLHTHHLFALSSPSTIHDPPTTSYVNSAQQTRYL